MRNSGYRNTRPVLLSGVLVFLIASTPAWAVGGPPLASGPERATNDPYFNTLNAPSAGGYDKTYRGPKGRQSRCRFYNPYIPFQNQPNCQ